VNQEVKRSQQHSFSRSKEIEIGRRDEGGFTLLEVIISMVIVAIGFVGVYGLVALSDRALQETVDREQMVLRAGQIMEEIGNELIVNSPVIGLGSFANVNLKIANCNFGGGFSDNIKRRWCQRLNDYLGLPNPLDTRTIRVTTPVGEPNRRLIKVTLSTKNGTSQVSVARKYNVPTP
jgi:prepilin-type N-terminal cleavage/methylation domain-containing protein